MLELRLLGSFEVRLDDTVVLLASRPAQSLLAYLTLNAGIAHRREKLAGLFWPDADEDNARSNLRHALWRLRKAIELKEAVAPYLLTDEFAVSFNAGADFWLDAAVLTRDADGLQEQLEALSVYRGPLLPGFYDDWVTLERERLEAVFQHKMQRALERLVDERRWSAVLEWGERWVALGHAPEPGYRALMRAHAGLRMAAVYQRCREALFNELGVEPSIQTRRLYERLRQDDGEATVVLPTAVDTDAPAAGDPPFQGLRFFDEGDADRFFGRERLTARLLARLDGEPFLAVLGASGSGKSSVVRAGLAPALRRTQSAVHILTPTRHPIDSLAASLGSNGEREALLEELSRDPHGLRRLIKRKQWPSVVLVVDQFEELFTLCQDPFEREAFAENIIAATDAGLSTRVVIALRADFYAQCAQYPTLREAVAQHQEYVGALGASELRQAIEGPAAHGNWEIESGLVELLLRDVGDEPGSLPLLSHALHETWLRRRGRRMTLAGYTAAGGVQGAIAQTAESVFADRLTVDQRAIARRVFLALTELGEGTQDTRRRATLDELVRSPDEDSEVRAVLGVLADARLVTLGNSTAEVAHEALIREWTRLREWLAEERASLRLQRQLDAAAREWQRLGRDADSLYRGARLTQAVEWADEHVDDLSSLERAFLDAATRAARDEASRLEAQRQRELQAARQLAQAEQRKAEAERERADEQQRRADEQRSAASLLRQRALLLGVAFALALSMAGAAVFLGNTSRELAIHAQADARGAIARELSAAALTNLSVDPERAALLALGAVDATHSVDGTWTAEAEDALHRVLPLLRAQLTLVGHTGKVLSVGFSPDGQHLATAGEDGTARVWSASSGQLELMLKGHDGAVNAIAFGPSGTSIATAGDDHTARIWDGATGRQRLLLTGQTREVERLAFRPDGKLLATSSLDGTVSLWNTETGQAQLMFRPGTVGESAVPLDLAFTPDGGGLATINPLGQVDLWDLSSQPPRLVRSWIPPPTGATSHAVAFTADGTRVAATTETGAQVWWTGTGAPVVNIVGHPLQILDATFSPDSARLATASVDQTARLWDAQTGRELVALAGHTGPVDRVAFSPDGQRLATASWDGTAKVWDLSPPHELLTVTTPGALASFPTRLRDAPLLGQIATSHDAGRIFAGLWDGTATLWDARTGQPVLSVGGHTGQVWGAAISPDGARVATGSADRNVRVWDATTGDLEWTGGGHSDGVAAVAFTPDGTRLASASVDRTVKLWDVAFGTELFGLSGQSDALTSVAFSPDAAQLATATEGHTDNVRVWDARTGQSLLTLAGHADAVWSVAFSPDGKRLVTASRDGTIRVWDAASGEDALTIQGHTGTVAGAVFGPDGQRIASGSRDGSVQVWDASTGLELLALPPANVGDGVDSLVFTPDGRQLVVRTDQAVRTYVVPIDDLTALAQSRLTRWWTLEECQRFLHLDECPPQRAGGSVESAPPVAAHSESLARVAPFAAAPAAPAPSSVTGSIKIVSSLARGGLAKAQTDMVIRAYEMALEDHHYVVGNTTVSLEDLSNSGGARVPRIRRAKPPTRIRRSTTRMSWCTSGHLSRDSRVRRFQSCAPRSWRWLLMRRHTRV